MKTRQIEMYVGLQGNNQSWISWYVDIPANTPENQIEEVAKTETLKDLAESQSDLQVAFVGVYHIPEEEDSNEPDLHRIEQMQELEEIRDCFQPKNETLIPFDCENSYKDENGEIPDPFEGMPD